MTKSSNVLLAADEIHFELRAAASLQMAATFILLQHLAGSHLAVTFDVLIKAETGTYCQMGSRVCCVNMTSPRWSKANVPFFIK